MRRFATLYRHELQAVIQDRGVLLIFIGAVIIYSFFYPIPYLPEVLKEVPVVAVDEDHTALSRKLIRMADAGDLVRISGQASTVAEAEKRIKAGKASGVLVIPREFERKVLRGENATVGLFCDASYFLVYRQAMTGLLAATKALSAGIEIRKLQGRGTMAAHAKAVRNPVLLINRPLFNRPRVTLLVVPAVMVLILQQTLLIGIGMLGGTRRENSSGENTGTGASALMSVLSKAAVYLSIYFLHMIYYFFVVFSLYGFPQKGTPFTILSFMLPFLVSVTLLGIFINGFFRRRETSIQVLLFTSLPAIFLAGFAWPVEAIPSWLRILSFLLPTTAGIEGFLRVSEMGASLRNVSFEWGVLWGLCICTASCLGAVSLKHKTAAKDVNAPSESRVAPNRNTPSRSENARVAIPSDAAFEPSS